MTERRSRVLIFGGTSEGRELVEYAERSHVPVLVSVVSEYGEQLLQESRYVRVRQGALSREEMKTLLMEEHPELVLDATHPYARIVTEQIRELCKSCGISCQRVIREATDRISDNGQTEVINGIQQSGQTAEADRTQPGIYRVKSVEEAVAVLTQDREPVLLTTGSKELAAFAKEPQLKNRLYARVLPDSRVLASCEALGIHGPQLIAMQGPFSVSMNRALLEQTGAKWLVTKEAGSRGGFVEKLQAARECAVSVIVIERPAEESGLSLAQAEALLEQYGEKNPEMTDDMGASDDQNRPARELYLIGMGMGGGRQLTLEAVEVLKQCDAVLGAPRMLKDVAEWTAQAVREACYLPEPVLDWLEHHLECRKAAVVYSGDTGFFSGSGSLLKKVQEESRLPDWNIRVLPGISSVSNLCAAMGISWDHMYLASAHGRACDVVKLVKEHERVFLLLGGSENLQTVSRRLTEAGYGKTRVRAGIRMGYAEEAWIDRQAEQLADISRDAGELAAVVLERRIDSENEGKNDER